MNIIQAFREVFSATQIRSRSDKAEAEEFKYRRQTLLRERSTIQQLHRELKDNLLHMEQNNPPIKAQLIRVAPELAKYMNLAVQGVRLELRETPTLGVFRIEREDDVLL